MINIAHVTKNDKIQRQVHITYYPFLMRVGQTVLPLFERAMLFTKLIQSVYVFTQNNILQNYAF